MRVVNAQPWAKKGGGTGDAVGGTPFCKAVTAFFVKKTAPPAPLKPKKYQKNPLTTRVSVLLGPTLGDPWKAVAPKAQGPHHHKDEQDRHSKKRYQFVVWINGKALL